LVRLYGTGFIAMPPLFSFAKKKINIAISCREMLGKKFTNIHLHWMSLFYIKG